MFLAGFLFLCMFGFSSVCNGIFFRKKNKLLPNANGFPSVSNCGFLPKEKRVFLYKEMF